MASKQFIIDEVTVHVYKRRGGRSLRISIVQGQRVRVSIPAWAPYKAGVEFARTRLDWVRQHLAEQAAEPLREGQPIGKAHHLHFSPSERIKSPSGRVSTGKVTVTYPAGLSPDDDNVQLAARKAGVRALRSQAEKLLPQRLKLLADKHGFEYRSISIKQLKRRWGSCDQHKNIVLNLYLMQLPWEAIDYVILHELVHTTVLHHGPEFWDGMERVLPGARVKRKMMRQYRTQLAAL